MIWIFVRRDYGALECVNVAGRSVLLKARSQCTQPLMAAIRINTGAGLKQALDAHGFDAAIGGARRDVMAAGDWRTVSLAPSVPPETDRGDQRE
jgi:hypothetical protein